MKLYGELENHKLKIENQVVAKNKGLPLVEVEEAYDGTLWEVGYAPEKPAETTEEKLQRLESEYDMNRWQREAILAEGSPYSDFTKARARELEDLAEELRREKEDSSMEG